MGYTCDKDTVHFLDIVYEHYCTVYRLASVNLDLNLLPASTLPRKERFFSSSSSRDGRIISFFMPNKKGMRDEDGFFCPLLFLLD